MTFLWPQRLPTASEVTPGLRTELSDLINPCYHASLTSKWLHELNATDARTYARTAKRHPLTCVATPQVKKSIFNQVNDMLCYHSNLIPNRAEVHFTLLKEEKAQHFFCRRSSISASKVPFIAGNLACRRKQPIACLGRSLARSLAFLTASQRQPTRILFPFGVARHR